MQSTGGPFTNQQPTADRELLADAPCSEAQRVASFTELFQRPGACTLWEKFTHSLLMPLRRYWARQQVAKVLEIARNKGLDELTSVRSLRQEFDADAGIHQSKAQAVAIDIMLNGEIPDASWLPTFNDYLDRMQVWCATLISSEGGGKTSASLNANSPQLQGLKRLIEFSKHPECAVSVAESKDVQSFMKALRGNDYDNTSHPGPAYHDALTKIYERYIGALEVPEQTTEKSSRHLSTPAMQRRQKDVWSATSTALLDAPEFIHHPELVAAFNTFTETQNRPMKPRDLSPSEKRTLYQFLGRFALAFQRNPQGLIALCPSVIALEDALLDRTDLEKTIELQANNHDYKFLKALQASGFSPSCLLALAEYLLVSQAAQATAIPPAHPPRLNPESWMRLRYVYDSRETWQRSLPLGKSTELSAREVLQRLSKDIAAFELKFILPHLPKKARSTDDDDI